MYILPAFEICQIYIKSFLVSPTFVEQGGLSSHCGVWLFVCLLACLLVDRELNFNYDTRRLTRLISEINTRWLSYVVPLLLRKCRITEKRVQAWHNADKHFLLSHSIFQVKSNCNIVNRLWFQSFRYLPTAYVVRREGYVLTRVCLSVCPHLGGYPGQVQTGGYPSQVQLGGTPCRGYPTLDPPWQGGVPHLG